MWIDSRGKMNVAYNWPYDRPMAIYQHLLIYFGLSLDCYVKFNTLTSVEKRCELSMLKIFPLFCTIVKLNFTIQKNDIWKICLLLFSIH